MPKRNVFTVRGLTFAYDGGHPIFRDFDIDIREGAVTTLIGANGCGKSTLFNLLTKGLSPQSGTVCLRGEDIAGLSLREFAKRVAIVHQKNVAPSDITVEKLVEYGRYPLRKRGFGGSTEEDASMVAWAIGICGLEEVADKAASALSGGQLQRVWIAMALAQGCDVLLLDEPTTYLDVRYQLDILDLVRRLNRELGMTVVMVLHDVNQALYYSNEIVALAQGEVVAQGVPSRVVDAELLREVYGVDLDIVYVDGMPFVLNANDEQVENPLVERPMADMYRSMVQGEPIEALERVARQLDEAAKGSGTESRKVESERTSGAEPEAGVPAKQRPKLVRGLWAAAGFASFGLGALGAVLPVLPTTPLILLAAFCFARSSDKLNNWFKSTKLYKTVLEGYVTKRAMTVKAKLSIIVPVTIVMAIAFAFMGRVMVVGGVPVGRVVLAVVWAAHIVYFGFMVKTEKGDGLEGVSQKDAPAGRLAAGKSKKGNGGMPMIKTRLFELLSDAKAYIWYQVGWKWLSLLAQILIAFSAAHIIQMAFDGIWVTWDVGWCIAFVFAGIVVRVWCDRREQANAYLASVDVKRILRAKIYDKLLRLGASYRESVATSKVVQLAVEGVEQLETYFSLFLSQLFYAFLAPLSLFVVVGLFVNWPTAIVLLVFVPLIPISIMVVQTIAKKLLSRYWNSYTELGDTFLENLQGLTTLKIYQADERATDLMDDDSEAFRVATMNVLKMQLNSTTIMDIGAYGGAAAGMIVALSQYFAGNVTVGGMVVVLLLAAEFFLPMRRLGSYFHIAMNGMAASDNIFELLDLPERDEGALAVLAGDEASFELSEVVFSYDGNRRVLDGVSMEFPQGSFTSIVGVSGCGKSTVASLLMGRNRSYEGAVRINGVEVRDVAERSLMDHVTLVSSSSHLFKGTVRENLMIGNPNSAESELRQVIECVNLKEFLDGQEGLDTMVAEGGANLSGGQRQRLALARALLHDTPAYIFDEATSSVDVESEEDIMKLIHELAKTRTVILISHRLANVVDSDRIYMMEDGRVAEQGTHDELVAADGSYAALFGQQMELEGYAAHVARSSARKRIELEGRGSCDE